MKKLQENRQLTWQTCGEGRDTAKLSVATETVAHEYVSRQYNDTINVYNRERNILR